MNDNQNEKQFLAQISDDKVKIEILSKYSDHCFISKLIKHAQKNTPKSLLLLAIKLETNLNVAIENLYPQYKQLPETEQKTIIQNLVSDNIESETNKLILENIFKLYNPLRGLYLLLLVIVSILNIWIYIISESNYIYEEQKKSENNANNFSHIKIIIYKKLYIPTSIITLRRSLNLKKIGDIILFTWGACVTILSSYKSIPFFIKFFFKKFSLSLFSKKIETKLRTNNVNSIINENNLTTSVIHFTKKIQPLPVSPSKVKLAQVNEKKSFKWRSFFFYFISFSASIFTIVSGIVNFKKSKYFLVSNFEDSNSVELFHLCRNSNSNFCNENSFYSSQTINHNLKPFISSKLDKIEINGAEINNSDISNSIITNSIMVNSIIKNSTIESSILINSTLYENNNVTQCLYDELTKLKELDYKQLKSFDEKYKEKKKSTNIKYFDEIDSEDGKNELILTILGTLFFLLSLE